jgi:hypothetical protein
MTFGPAPLPSIGLLYDPTAYEPGLFALRGYKAELLYGRKLAAEYAEYAITGQDADLTKDTPTPIGAGPLPPFTYLTFGAAGVSVMPAETGYYALNGQAAALLKGRGLTGEPGLWTISVAPALRDIELTAAVRLFQVLGQDATMTWARGMAGAYGSYTLTGQAAGYVLVSGPDRSMSADPGRWYMNLIDRLPPGVGYENATLIYTRQLQCDAGVFTLTGQSATLAGPVWSDVSDSSGTWTYVTPGGGVWIDVDPDS